ncbi:MAG: MCP four helix bundle domain-containing protein, partial [Oscillospiraceae bacterium]|nr:MCP four helix bundle domain-containing protein [Oscillospiraceae bacterium]
MKKLTVRNILLLSFVIMFALCLIIGGVSISSINEINLREQDMYDYASAVNVLGVAMEHLQKINAELYRSAVYREHKDMDEIESADTNIDNSIGEIQDAIEEYLITAFDKDKEKHFHDFVSVYKDEFLPLVHRVKTDFFKNDDIEAVLNAIPQIKEISAKLENSIAASVSDNVEWRNEDIKSNQDFSANALLMQSIAIIISLLFALFFALYLSGKVGKMSKTIEAQAAHIQSENERMKLLLDTSPLACRIWDKNYQIIECNEESLRLFGVKSRQELSDRYFEFLPEYQSDGTKSKERKKEILDTTFAEGRNVLEISYFLPDGTEIPCEVTLVRVMYGDDYVIAGYTRDLREHKRMISVIEKRDNLLGVMNRAATVLL